VFHQTSSPCGLFSRAEDKVKLSDDVTEEACTLSATVVELFHALRRPLGVLPHESPIPSSRNAVNNSSARTTKRFPSPRCAADFPGSAPPRPCRAASLESAFDRCFGTVVKNQWPQGGMGPSPSAGNEFSIGFRRWTSSSACSSREKTLPDGLIRVASLAFRIPLPHGFQCKQ
jgi:hypothetical protein